MKIAIFSDCYLDLTGGIVSSINAQKAALEALGHKVYVFSSGYPKTPSQLKSLARQNIFVVPSCKLLLRGLTPVSRRPKIVEKWLLTNHPEIKRFDVFYVHYEAGCSIAGLRLAKHYKIPSVQVMHGREDMGVSNLVPRGFRTIAAIALNLFHSWYIPHTVKVRRDKRLADTIAKAKMWTLMVNHANYADLVFTPSKHFKRKLTSYGVKTKIKVLPNGFPDDKMPEDPKVRKLNIGEELRMIWHSRVSSEKRIMPFLKAVSEIDGHYRLDVYGDGNDLRRAERFAKRHHLRVKFYGNVSYYRVVKALSEAHLDVLTSYNYDTFGMTLIEAESAGVPVFFCDKDMKEVVPDGSYVLSPSPEPAAMAESINQLLAYPDRIREMSQVMLDHRDEVRITNRIKALEDIFNDIIKS